MDGIEKSLEISLQKKIFEALDADVEHFRKQLLREMESQWIIRGKAIADIKSAQEAWPQPIKLYQPYEVEQILLPDNANCLAVQAFLHMLNLEYQVEPRKNAEYMSPSGRVPFIQCGAFLVSDFDNIVSFVGNKGARLSQDLDETEKTDMRAYISLVNNGLANAEQYICWVDPATLEQVTKTRHGSVYPWPLNHILNWQKQRQITKKLKVLGLYNKSIEEIYQDVKMCCTALSERLDGKPYFYGNKPCELDALVYGHIQAILRSQTVPSLQELVKIIGTYPDLIEHSKNVQFRITKDSKAEEQANDEEDDPIWDISDSIEILSPVSTGPKELDALVFGHLFTILTTPLPAKRLAEIVKEFPDLVDLCKRIEKRYFQRNED